MIRLTQPELVHDKKQQGSSSPDEGATAVKKEAEAEPITSQTADPASSGTESSLLTVDQLLINRTHKQTPRLLFQTRWMKQGINPRTPPPPQETPRSWGNQQSPQEERHRRSPARTPSFSACLRFWTITTTPSLQCRSAIALRSLFMLDSFHFSPLLSPDLLEPTNVSAFVFC